MEMDASVEPTALRRFEIREGIEMVPGTVHLIDIQGDSRLKHRKDTRNDVVLIPQPTNDPDDPLNWSRVRKEYHFSILIVWSILVAASVNWSGPVWVPLQLDLNTTIDDLNISAALCFAFLAIGCILLQPTAMKIGRRPVYIVGTFLNLVGCILGGLQKTIEVYYIVNILTGFGAAPVDSLVQISTTDIFFAHERGTRLSILAFALGAGSYMGPVAAGYITESQSWRWCFWYLVIFFAIILVLQAFTMEESIYRRPPQATLSQHQNLTEIEGSLALGGKESTAGARTIAVLPTSTFHPSELSSETSTFIGSRRTYLQRLALTHTKYANPKPWWRLALYPFRLFLFPAILWAAIMSGVQICWLSLLSVTQSELFSAPPYNFGIAAVGDTNIAAFVGGIFGMLWGGPLSDWWVVRQARGNRGIMEPESRLWLLIVPGLINAAGLLMYGLGAYGGLHWMVSAGVGTAFIGFGIGSAGAICITYAIDAYPEIAAESMVLILFCRNVLGFAFTFAIQPWIDAQGGKGTTIVLAVICLIATMTFLILIRWGKSFRTKTANTYLSYIEQRVG